MRCKLFFLFNEMNIFQYNHEELDFGYIYSSMIIIFELQTELSIEEMDRDKCLKLKNVQGKKIKASQFRCMSCK